MNESRHFPQFIDEARGNRYTAHPSPAGRIFDAQASRPDRLSITPMDRLERGISDEYGLRFLFVSATETASALARRHRSNTAAIDILAQALVAVGLLSSDLENEDECISIQLRTNGPIQGLLVEASYGGTLRGYTQRKTVPARLSLAEVMGTQGDMAVLLSKPGRLLYSGRVPATPPDIAKNLAWYYNMSRQIPTAVSLLTSFAKGKLHRAVGFICQKLPYADSEKFVEVLECFNDDTIKRRLFDARSLAESSESLPLRDLVTVGHESLMFKCRCSYKKILDVLSALPDSDIREMAGSTEPQSVTCHFCGEIFPISAAELTRILARRQV